MKRWRFSPKAWRELMAIWHHTAERGSIDQAERNLHKIEHDLTAATADSPLVRPFGEYHRGTSGRHDRVFLRDTASSIVVLRVPHRSQDIPTRMED